MPNAILTPAATTGTASAWRAGWVMVRRVHLKLEVSIIRKNSLRIAYCRKSKKNGCLQR